MKWLRRIAVALGILLAIAAAAGFLLYRRMSRMPERIGEVVSAADRAAEDARLTALGLKVPPGGVVLERPYAQPFSSRSFVVPSSWHALGLQRILAGRASVRADLLLRDLDVLEAAMERSYGGWDSAARRGWDWGKAFEGWRAMLRAKGSEWLSADEAFAPLDALGAVRIDNHTNVPLMRFNASSLSQTALLASRPSAPCTEVENGKGEKLALRSDDPGEQPRTALQPTADLRGLEEATYIALPSRLGELKRIRCGEAWIPLAGGIPRRNTLWDMWRRERERQPELEVRRLSEDVVYLRLPTFAPDNYAHLEEQKSAWPTPKGKERAVIVDLRDNGGGAAGFGTPVLEPWLDVKALPGLDDMRVSLAKSCLYPAFRWNFHNGFLGEGALGEEERAGRQEFLDALARPAPEGCPRVVETTNGKLRYRATPLKRGHDGRRILVWVNGGCGSDCEYLVQQLATLPESAIVGTNTGGVCQFIQPGLGFLPNTRLAFRFALGESDVYGDGRSVDGHGLDVDVVLRDDADWTPEKVARLVDAL